MNKNILKPYYNKLISEGLLRAIFCGLIVGFSVLFVAALVCWYFAFKGYWLMIVLSVLTTVIATTLFYFLKYRPNLKQVSARVDELGLEERILTMNQLQGDNSYIAQKQREDAMNALQIVKASNIAVTIALSLVLAMPPVAVASAGVTTVYGLHVAGILPSGREVLFQIIQPAPQDIKVQFKADGGGTVGGYADQTIQEGNSADAVVAIPNTGYAFSHWTWKEGTTIKVETSPYFVAKEVYEDTLYTAVFTELEKYEEPVPGLEGGEGGDQKGPKGPSSDTDLPPASGGEDEGEPNPDAPGDGSGSTGSKLDQNQVLDGETYYGDLYGDAKDTAMDNISKNDDMSDDMKDFIEDYFEAIKKQESEGND